VVLRNVLLDLLRGAALALHITFIFIIFEYQQPESRPGGGPARWTARVRQLDEAFPYQHI